MRRFVVVAAPVAAAAVLSAPPALGQSASILFGATHARYADSLAGSAAYASSEFSLVRPHSTLALDAGFAQFTTGGWAGQLGARGTAVYPVSAAAAVGLSGNAGVNALDGGLWSGTGSVGPLLAMSRGPAIGVLSVAVGGVRAFRGTTSPLASGAASLRYAVQPGLAIEGGVAGTATDTLRFADASAGFVATVPGYTIEARLGVRAGDLADGAWGHLEIQRPLAGRATLEIAAGRYPADLTGFNHGMFATAGVRLGLGHRVPQVIAGGASPGVRVRRLGPDRVRLTVRYEGPASRLAIAGDWNDWEPVDLTPLRRNQWTVVVSASPGLHKFALVANGRDWTVPSGVTTVPDDFGGEVAVLMIEDLED